MCADAGRESACKRTVIGDRCQLQFIAWRESTKGQRAEYITHFRHLNHPLQIGGIIKDHTNLGIADDFRNRHSRCRDIHAIIAHVSKVALIQRQRTGAEDVIQTIRVGGEQGIFRGSHRFGRSFDGCSKIVISRTIPECNRQR